MAGASLESATLGPESDWANPLKQEVELVVVCFEREVLPVPEV